MTKKELALSISQTYDISQSAAITYVDLVIGAIRESLDAGEEVTLRGFGSFKPVKAAARSGRNLRTQERVKIPSKIRIKFKSYMEETEVGGE